MTTGPQTPQAARAQARAAADLTLGQALLIMIKDIMFYLSCGFILGYLIGKVIY